VDPTGEFGIVGALLGGGVELGLQLATNGGNFRCINWWDVGVSAAVGAVAPGWLNVGKTALKSGKAISTLTSQSANTANRAAKIGQRIQKNAVSITNLAATGGIPGGKGVRQGDYWR
jgi:hypothetical protein